MARRGSSTMSLKKKREEQKEKVKNLGGTKKYVSNRTGESTTTTTPAKKLSGKERAQKMARERLAAKKAGTYKKPKTAKELAIARLKIKKKK